MKKYTFTIEVEEIESSNSFADMIKSEVSEDIRQQELTRVINKATEVAHADILEGLVSRLNKNLEGLGCEFIVSQHRLEYDKNGYSNRTAILKLGSNCHSHGIRINGESDRSFNDSKYMTYTGSYTLEVCRLNYACWSSSLNWSRVTDEGKILDYIKDSVMKFYQSNLSQ